MDLPSGWGLAGETAAVLPRRQRPPPTRGLAGEPSFLWCTRPFREGFILRGQTLGSSVFYWENTRKLT